MKIYDRVSKLLNTIKGQYLIPEVKIIDGQFYNVYDLVSAYLGQNYDTKQIYEFLTPYFGAEISAYGIAKIILDLNASIRDYKSLFEKLGLDNDESSRLARSVIEYFKGREQDIELQAEEINADNETRNYYLNNYEAYAEEANIFSSNINIQTRDLVINFETGDLNVYNTLAIFNALEINDKVPFAIALNFDNKVYTKIYELYETDIQKIRTFNSFNAAHKLIHDEQAKIRTILSERQKYSLDVFQLLEDKVTNPAEFLKSMIIIGFNSAAKRNVDLLTIKFSQKMEPLKASIRFPSSVHPRGSEIESLLDTYLLPDIPRTYNVGKYRANLTFFGININPSLFLNILEPPYDQYITTEEINSLLTQRQKINYTYLNEISQLGIKVRVACSFTGQGSLKHEEILQIADEDVRIAQGTNFINFSLVKVNNEKDLYMMANLLEVLLVNYYMMINNLPPANPELPVAQLASSHWQHFNNVRNYVLATLKLDIFEPTRLGADFNISRIKRIDKLRELAPDIIDNTYATKCAGTKQPNVVPYDESVEEDESQISLPIDDPKYTFVCDRENYPYATLVYSNQNLYPCCTNIENSRQIEEAKKKYETSEETSGVRRGTIRVLQPEMSSQALPANLTRLISGISDISLTRVGVSKSHNLISAVYYSLFGKHFPHEQINEFFDNLRYVNPAVTAEQLWDSYSNSIYDLQHENIKYKTHFRAVAELFSKFTGNDIDILAITGNRSTFKFVYPRFNRYLAWRPSKAHKLVVVYEHENGYYDAIVNKVFFAESYANLQLLIDIFTESLANFSNQSITETELPNDCQFLAQMLDQYGHLQYLKLKHNGSIFFVARKLEAPRNLPVFTNFEEAPDLATLISNLKSSNLLTEELTFLTTDQMEKIGSITNVVGIKTANYTFICNNTNDDRIINLGIKNTQILNLNTIKNNDDTDMIILKNLFVSSQLKYIISWLLQAYKREYPEPDVDLCLQRFIESYFTINNQVKYDFVQLNDYLIPSTIQDILAYLTELELDFVQDNKIQVSSKLYAKLFNYCKSIYYNPVKEYLPFKYQLISSLQQAEHQQVSIFYDQSQVDISELQSQVYYSLPKYLIQFNILVNIDNQDYVYGLQRYQNLDSFLRNHPEIIAFPQIIHIFNYINQILVYSMTITEYQKPDSINKLRATEENGQISLITDNEYYYEIKYYLPKELK